MKSPMSERSQQRSSLAVASRDRLACAVSVDEINEMLNGDGWKAHRAILEEEIARCHTELETAQGPQVHVYQGRIAVLRDLLKPAYADTLRQVGED